MPDTDARLVISAPCPAASDRTETGSMLMLVAVGSVAGLVVAMLGIVGNAAAVAAERRAVAVDAVDAVVDAVVLEDSHKLDRLGWR